MFHQRERRQNDFDEEAEVLVPHQYVESSVNDPLNESNNNSNSLLQQALLSPSSSEPQLPQSEEQNASNRSDLHTNNSSFILPFFSWRSFWKPVSQLTSQGNHEPRRSTFDDGSNNRNRRIIQRRDVSSRTSIRNNHNVISNNSNHSYESDYSILEDEEEVDDTVADLRNAPNDHEDELLSCYFWSFLFRTYDIDCNTSPRRSTIIRLTLLLFMVIIWPCGMQSFVHVLDHTVASTDITSLFQESTYYKSKHLAHSAFRWAHPNTTTNSNAMSMEFSMPIILVLYSNNIVNTPNHTANIDSIVTDTCTPNAKLTSRGSLLYKQGYDFALGVEKYLISQFNNHQNYNFSNTENTTNSAPIIRITSFYSLIDDGLYSWAWKDMAYPDGSSTLVQIDFKMTQHPIQERLADYALRRNLMKAVDDYTNQFFAAYNNSTIPLCFSVNATGLPLLQVELGVEMKRTTWTILAFVLPLSIILISLSLWYFYAANPWLIWIIPAVTILSSLSLQFILVEYLVVPYFSGASLFTPIFMIVISLAEFSTQVLFLLSRYLEELHTAKSFLPIPTNQGKIIYRAVQRMLQSIGSTLISAGWMFLILLLIFSISPAAIVQRTMIELIVGISTVTCVNLVLIPTMLSYTPLGTIISNVGNLQYDAPTEINHIYNIGDPQRDILEIQSSREHDNDLFLGASNGIAAQSFSAQMLPTPRNSIWFCIARNIVHPYRGIILLLVILQLLIPIAYRAKNIRLSFQISNMLSACNNHLLSYTKLGNNVGRGRLYPYWILFDGHFSNTSMTSEKGFAAMHLVFNEIQYHCVSPVSLTLKVVVPDTAVELNNTYTRTMEIENYISSSFVTNQLTTKPFKSSVFNGIAVVNNIMISYDTFRLAKYCTHAPKTMRFCPFERLRMIAANDKLVTSNDTYVTYMQVHLCADPFSREGMNWLSNVRDKLDLLRRRHELSGIEIEIEGPGALVHDSVHSIYESSYENGLIALLVVAILITIFFTSLTLSIRSILSIGFTISFAMGLTILVYMDGILNWTNMLSISTPVDDKGVSWLVLIFALPVLVGLELKCDYVLISRIQEFRTMGYEHKSSLALGLDAVGSINACAGLIAAITFGATLVVSQNRMLHQWSFVITSSVLLGTFVIRTVVIPIMIGLFPFNWWPRKAPVEKFCLEEFNFCNPLELDGSVSHDTGTYWETLITTSEYEPLNHNR
jgi:predicted RND superfamily exporter protein